MSEPAKVGPERIMQMAWGYAPPIIIEAAIDLHFFDMLSDSAMSVESVAAKSGASVRGTRALLNALVGLNLLERRDSRYHLTPDSAKFLVSASPDFRGTFFHHGLRQLLPHWLRLSDAVRSGSPVLAVDEEETGGGYFAQFVEGLFNSNQPAAAAWAKHRRVAEWEKPFSVLDIGAGSGVWGIAVAKASPHGRMLAVDWPQVLEITKKVAARHGLSERLTVSPGDLLRADFGGGHRVAVVGHILHSEGQERSRKLLGRIYDALEPGGTLAIAEWIPNEERTGPPAALTFAVNMLIHTKEGDT